jgi:exopolysaccharide biosynthesis polyprenyl glycosylphosphotransferase
VRASTVVGTVSSMSRAPNVRSGLKAILIVLDVVALLVAWLPLTLVNLSTAERRPTESLFISLGAVLIALAMMRYEGLWLSRLCAVRSIEVRLIARSSAYTAVGLLIADRVLLSPLGSSLALREILIGTGAMIVLLVIERSVFRSASRVNRQHGNNGRDVIILGAGVHAAHLVNLISDHPDYGMRVIGVVGDGDAAAQNGLLGRWLGPIERAEEIATMHMVTGVVLSAAASEYPGIVPLVKRLQRRQIHVQIASGLTGFDVARLRQLHLAREPMIYLEQVRPRRIDFVVKRGIDLLVSLAVLVLSLPLLVLAALAIKVTDPGPVFFKQVRVGKNGHLFTLYKFRTMVVDAEKRMAALARDNERNGPLFKMQGDPRVTKVGKLLRLSSIDEIPQLLNVLKGQMSLVGPRPALPKEVLEFDADLRRRELVKPGITGLWQVEARDSPSFDAYRRLDLFYVDNWTLIGDLDIMLDTLEHMLGRLIGSFRRSDEQGETVAAAEASPALQLVAERQSSAV